MGAALGLREPQHLHLRGGQVSLPASPPCPSSLVAPVLGTGSWSLPTPGPHSPRAPGAPRARSVPAALSDPPSPLSLEPCSSCLLIICFWSLEAPCVKLSPSLISDVSQLGGIFNRRLELPFEILASIYFLVGHIFYIPIDVTKSFEQYFPPHLPPPVNQKGSHLPGEEMRLIEMKCG